MKKVLLNLWNEKQTRKYLMDQLGIGMNLPLFSAEYQGGEKDEIEFLFLTYVYNQKGLYAIEGKYKFEKGIANIIEVGILYVWERPKTYQYDDSCYKKTINFHIKWLIDNVSWLNEMSLRHSL